MDNPAFVDAEWMVYNEEHEEILGGDYRPNDYYFVVDEEVIQNIRTAMFTVPATNLMVTGRLAKDERKPGVVKYRAFVYGYESRAVPPAEGGIASRGTGGPASGAKIPANGQ